MAYENKCPFCGANLDPGEKCDCEEAKEIDTTVLYDGEKKPYEKIQAS